MYHQLSLHVGLLGGLLKNCHNNCLVLGHIKGVQAPPPQAQQVYSKPIKYISYTRLTPILPTFAITNQNIYFPKCMVVCGVVTSIRGAAVCCHQQEIRPHSLSIDTLQ